MKKVRKSRIGRVKTVGLKGFRQSYEKAAPRRSGLRTELKDRIMKVLGTSERNFYQILNGDRSMSRQEWYLIKQEFKSLGLKAEIDKACNEPVRDGVVKVEDTTYYDILYNEILDAAMSAQLDTVDYIDVDYSDRGYYFKVKFSISEDRYESRYFDLLEIEGGFTEDGVKWDFGYLIKTLFRKYF